MKKKWRLQLPEDFVELKRAHYYLVQKIDQWGPRVFFAVPVPYNDSFIVQLFDAAGDWGLAPFAFEIPRLQYKIEELGTWSLMLQEHRQSVLTLSELSQEHSVEGGCTDSGLMLLRSAWSAKKKGISNNRKLLWQELQEQRALDKKILEQKRSNFLQTYPDWEQEERRLKQQVSSALAKKQSAL